jgi:hypothetical protein
MGSSSSKVTRRYTPKPKLDTLYKPITNPGEYTLPASVLRDQERRKQQKAQEAASRPAASQDELGGPSQVRKQVEGMQRKAGSSRPEEGLSQDKDVKFLDMLKRAGYGGPLDGSSATVSSNTPSTSKQPTSVSIPQEAPANPSGNLFTARKQLAEEVKAHTEKLEESLGQTQRQWLEMSEIVRLLDARKQGASDAELDERFGLHPSVLARLGKRINTPTVTEATDDHGNAKGVWEERSG